jgi:nickel-dependent lactate racemase
MAVLRYGNNANLQMEFAEGVKPGEFGTPHGEPVVNLAAAATAALKQPIDYPPLAMSTTPADHIVLALDRGVPQVAEVTAAVVGVLVEAGVDPDGIVVLRNRADAEAGAESPCRLLPAPLVDRISLLTHDPNDRKQLAYLAASESGEALLINRALHEADLVLPVGCVRAEETAGYFGIHGAVFPAFSDSKTLQRFRNPSTLNGRATRKRVLIAEADRVAWLLGVNLTIQLVPAAGSGVLHVLVGQSDSVRRLGRELYRTAWGCTSVRGASLVVAGVEGDSRQQTWDNVGQALQAAGRFVDPDGSIAVCCELTTDPGPGLRHLAFADSRESALRRVGKKRPVDALPTAQIARAQESHKVYLLSGLDQSVVEDLDMIHLAGPDELIRLARRHASCNVVSNAPYVTVIDEDGGAK